MLYVTLEFNLTPTAVRRLPVACGWDAGGIIYGCTTDPRIDGNAIYASRIERNIGTSTVILLFISLDLWSPCEVYLCCGTRGEVNPPRTLDGMKAFARALPVKKPIPDWFYQFMDVLGEVEDTMTCSVVRVGTDGLFNSRELTQLKWMSSPNDVHPIPQSLKPS